MLDQSILQDNNIILSQIPFLSIFCMIITCIICFFVPIGIFFWWKRKTNSKIQVFFLGVGVYILFDFFVLQICNLFILTPSHTLGTHILDTPILYALYGAIATALFSELGHFFAMNFLPKFFPEKKSSVMYGIGHGGIEMLILGGFSTLSALSLSMSINSLGLEAYLAALPAESQESMLPAIQSLITSPAIFFLITGFEKFLTFLFHICMSILQFEAAVLKKYYWLPITIILHIFFCMPSMLYQTGLLQNIYIAIGWITIFVFLLSLFILFHYPKISARSESQ